MDGARTAGMIGSLGPWIAGVAVVVILLSGSTDARAGGGGPGVSLAEYSNTALGFRFRSDGLALERDQLFPPNPDPGKIRLEVSLTGNGGRIYVMVWSLDRLAPAEWFRRAVEPFLGPERSWDPVPWLTNVDEAVVVEAPSGPAWPAQRVYALRSGGLGFAVLCAGVEAPALSGSCDRVAETLEVVR